MGVLGSSTPEQVWDRLRRQAAQYGRPGRRAPLLAFELIATVAQADPGADGMYRARRPDSVISRYLQTVRRNHGILILDIQPGRSDFLTEAEALTRWLLQPDVGLAIDPEWRMAPDQVPAQEIGSVSAAEVNATSVWLDDLVRRHHLPQKLFLIHKFRSSMLTDEAAIRDRPNLYEVVNMDGFGGQGIKISEYREFAREGHFPMGIKLFYTQDTDLMSPGQALALDPAPAIVDYQ